MDPEDDVMVAEEGDLYFDDFDEVTSPPLAGHPSKDPLPFKPKDVSPGQAATAARGDQMSPSPSRDQAPTPKQEIPPQPVPMAPSLIPKAPERPRGGGGVSTREGNKPRAQGGKLPKDSADDDDDHGSAYVPSFLTAHTKTKSPPPSSASRLQPQASKPAPPSCLPPPSESSCHTTAPALQKLAQPSLHLETLAPAPAPAPAPLTDFPFYSSSSSCSLIEVDSPPPRPDHHGHQHGGEEEKEEQHRHKGGNSPSPQLPAPSALGSKLLFPTSLPSYQHKPPPAADTTEDGQKQKASTTPSPKEASKTAGTTTASSDTEPTPHTAAAATITTTTDATRPSPPASRGAKGLFPTSEIKPLFPSAPVPQWRIGASAGTAVPRCSDAIPEPQACQGFPKKDTKGRAQQPSVAATPPANINITPTPTHTSTAATTTSGCPAAREKHLPANANPTKAAATSTKLHAPTSTPTPATSTTKSHIPGGKAKRKLAKETAQSPMTLYISPPKYPIAPSPINTPTRRGPQAGRGSLPACLANLGPNTHVYFGLGKEMEDPDFDELEELEQANRELKAELEEYRQALRKSLQSQGPPVESFISRQQLNRFSEPSVLEKQLKLAQQKIDVYRRSNNMLKEKVARLSDNDLLEKLEHKVRTKEQRIQELQAESRALNCLRRNFEKQQLRDREAREHWPETVNSLQKDIRVYQFKLRRLKAFIEGLRKKEREQSEQIETLNTHNRELMERLAVGPDGEPLDVPLDSPTRAVRRGSKARERADQEQAIADERKKLEKDVEQLQRFLKQNKKSAECELKMLKRDLEEAREEKARLDAIMAAKEKEARLQHLQAKIMKRTLRDLIGGHIELRHAKAVVATLRHDQSDEELVALFGVKGSRPLPRSPHRKPPRPSPPSNCLTPHPPKEAGGSRRETPLSSSRRLLSEEQQATMEDDEYERELLAIAFDLKFPTAAGDRSPGHHKFPEDHGAMGSTASGQGAGRAAEEEHGGMKAERGRPQDNGDPISSQRPVMSPSQHQVSQANEDTQRAPVPRGCGHDATGGQGSAEAAMGPSPVKVVASASPVVPGQPEPVGAPPAPDEYDIRFDED